MDLTPEAIKALEGVAQESTLINLKGLGAGVGNLKDNTETSNKALESLGNVATDGSIALLKFGGSVFASNARISDGMKAVDKIAGSLGKNFNSGTLGVASKAFGAMSTAALTLVEAAESGVDTFRTLSSSGASFNNDIFAMKNAAAQSRLTLDEFAGIVSSNTQGFSAFGGTVTKGAQLFSRSSQRMFDEGLATPLLNMGMTFEEVNEDLAEYIVRNRRRFSDEDIATGKANASFVFMSKEMDKIAKITGQNRKELEKEVNDRARKGQVEAKIRMLEASGNKEAADKMKMALAEAAKAGPGALAAVEDLFTKGAVVSEEGRAAAVALGPAFNDLTNMVSYAKGKGGIEGMTTSIDNFNGAIAARISDPNFLQIATIGGMGNQFADAAAGLVETAGTYADNVQRLMDEGNTREQAIAILEKQAETEQKNREAVTQTVINGEKALRDMGALINDKLIGENGTLKKFAQELKPVGDALEEFKIGIQRTRQERIEASPDGGKTLGPRETGMRAEADEIFRGLDKLVGTSTFEGGRNAAAEKVSPEQKNLLDTAISVLKSDYEKDQNAVNAFNAVLQNAELNTAFLEELKSQADEQGITFAEAIKKVTNEVSDVAMIQGIAETIAKEKGLDPKATGDTIRAGAQVQADMSVTKMIVDQFQVTGVSSNITPTSVTGVSSQMNNVQGPSNSQTFETTQPTETVVRLDPQDLQKLSEYIVAAKAGDESSAEMLNTLKEGNRLAALAEKHAKRMNKGIGGLSGNLFKQA